MIEKFKCEYPGCKKDSIYRHTLNLINEKDASVDLPFCAYHYYIMIGGHFEAKIHKENERDRFEIIGPLKEIELIQQVMGAREMIANSKVTTKNLNKK